MQRLHFTEYPTMALEALIVDDQADVRDIISEIIHGTGVRVEAVESAEAALLYLKKHPVQLIICDISMKGMSGLQLLQEIREKGIVAAVVMITGHYENKQIIEALQLGALDYVTKPFDPADFLKKVPLWLEIGRRLHEVADDEDSSVESIQKQHRLIELFRLKNKKLADVPT